jgi:thiol-disulfide isomerase/thioredoxin
MDDPTSPASPSRPVPWSAIVVATLAAMVAMAVVLLLTGGSEDAASERPTGDTAEVDRADGSGELDLTPDEASADVLTRPYEDFDGREVILGDAIGDGRPTVVNFFASWCTPCVREMPAFEEVHQELGSEVRFLGLANRDRPEDALRTVEQTGVTYDTARDPDGELLTAFGGVIMPTTVFIGVDGTIAEVHSGELAGEELRERLAQHFGIDA